MRISWKPPLYGPNPYSKRPVVVANLSSDAEIDLKNLACAARELWSISGFDFSGLDGLIDFEKNSALSVIAQYSTAWSRLVLNHVRGYILDNGVASTKDGIELWVGFHDPKLSQYAVQFSISSLLGILSKNFDKIKFDHDLKHLWRACRVQHPDYQARIIMHAAYSRGITFEPAWEQPRHWRLGEGANSRICFESSSSEDSFLGTQVSRLKSNTKIALRSLGFPTPNFVLIKDAEDLEGAVKEIGFPCVVKPTDQGSGRGVSANLSQMSDVEEAYRIARSFTRAPIMLETHLQGDDHRIIVVDGTFVAAIRRVPPQVIGDGTRSIQELIMDKNSSRNIRIEGAGTFGFPIKVDEALSLKLKGDRLSLFDIPSKNEIVELRSNANLSTGGSCCEVTEITHPDIVKMSEIIAKSFNIRMLGIDYMTCDISKSPRDLSGGVVEINTTPGLDIFIAAGWTPEDAGSLCIGPCSGPIPKALLIVSDENFEDWKVSLSSAVLQYDIGWAGKDFAGFDGLEFNVHPRGGWAGVQTILAQRTVRDAIVLAKVSEIYQFGLPASHFELAVFIDNLESKYCSVVESISEKIVARESSWSSDKVIAGVISELISLRRSI